MLKAAKVATLFLVIATLLSLAFQVVVIPTPSMEGAVLVGDHLLIDRFAYGPEIPWTHLRLPRLKRPERGDVVSFHPPGHNDDVYLKRVIAIGGDHVEWREGLVFVNGQRRVDLCERSTSQDQQDIEVPIGQIYLLGDNRNHSEDSRSWGTVPETNVVGEPVMVLWSIASPTRRWLTSQSSVYLDHPIAHLRWQRLFQRIQ